MPQLQIHGLQRFEEESTANLKEQAVTSGKSTNRLD
jgi:hypothetical protein